MWPSIRNSGKHLGAEWCKCYDTAHVFHKTPVKWKPIQNDCDDACLKFSYKLHYSALYPAEWILTRQSVMSVMQSKNNSTFSLTIVLQLNEALFKHIDEAPPNKKFFVTVSYYEVM